MPTPPEDRKYYDLPTFDRFVKGQLDPKKFKVAAKALADFKVDFAKIQAGQLNSPSKDYRFIWDKTTGERKLFRGVVDPV